MSTVYVQFVNDSTGAAIVSYFQDAQPEIEGDGRVLGTVDSSDSRWGTYYNSQPVSAQPFMPVPTA